MAEEAPDGIKASISPIDVKKEPNPLDGLDLSMSPSMAFKRPLEQFGGQGAEDEHEAKRLKTDDNQEEEELPFEFDVSLLVQNALSNFSNELSGQSNQDADVVPTTEPVHAGEIMSFNSPPVIEGPPPPPAPAPASFISDPERYVRESQLHALASMALSMLIIATHQPLDEMVPKIQFTEFDHGRQLRRLKQGLEATKNIYSSDPVLHSEQLGMRDPDAATIFQLANIAQLGAWIMDGSIESMRQGDKFLLPMLQDSEGGLSRSAIDTWTGIKTHLAVDSLIGKPDELSSEQILRQFFTESVKQRLAERPSHLQLKEERGNEIAAALKIRQDELQELTQVEGGLASAKDKYTFHDILRPFSVHAREQLSMATQIAEKLGITLPVNEVSQASVNEVPQASVHEVPQASHEPIPMPETSEAMELNMDDLDNLGLDDLFEKQTSGLVESALASFLAQANETEEPVASMTNGNTNPEHAQETATADVSKPDDFLTPQINGNSLMTDYKELEALVAESTSNYVRTTLQGLSPAPYQPVVPASTADSMAAQSNYLSHLQHHNGHNPYYSSFPHGMQEPQPEQPSSETLPPNQTASSSDLYDKARQAALSKTTSHTRREGSHSTRRPWSQEEEKALMAGLDMVKGPHWSQILTLFGANGTISDILKDRTQVQLKDKARNLKLFFLKTNSEMPFYLQAVTGELKTRAPTQAARKEAEERARLNSEEDQAKLQGIMALAGGLQHPPQKRTSGSPVAAAGSAASPGQTANTQGTNPGQHNHTHAYPQTAAYHSTVAAGAQNRPGVQTTAQKTLQSIAQTPPRPQNQFPPQVPRPQSHPHPQPRPQQQHIASSQGTQSTNQRPPQQNGNPQQGAQQGLPQGSQQSQQPNQQQPTHHAVQQAVQPQNQQRMALPAQAAPQRPSLPPNTNTTGAAPAPASAPNTQASTASHTTYMQQQPRPQPQQTQPQSQSPVNAATQPAAAQTHTPAHAHTPTPAQIFTPASSGTPTPVTAAAQPHQHVAQSPQMAQPARAPSQPANPAQASASPSQATQVTQPAANRPVQQAQSSPPPTVSAQQPQGQPLQFPQPNQPAQASQSTRQTQPRESVQPNEPAPPAPQAQNQTSQQAEENNADETDMSPEARLLKGLQDALAGASSIDGFNGNSLG